MHKTKALKSVVNLIFTEQIKRFELTTQHRAERSDCSGQTYMKSLQRVNEHTPFRSVMYRWRIQFAMFEEPLCS